ncbi:hypothetical protein [Salinisphaera sp. Q1T1-3]|uniref:hypothetical protein n=1 Tax=Salinisphaera sp. Q1T1-3 TaxID=2321229 RepID=UPI000E75EF25|nr:hypothetical protein [Salinisphaera sp. Q1T1-3]RJS92045.1 hypothetical protein D3260_12940 [Salinisphaera sp. Q1T1-3]
MTRPTIVLAAEGALDVAAARRLADYGELDDAGVARALEQVHLQRWGTTMLPGHLCRVVRWAAVGVVRGRVRVASSAYDDDESAVLARLDELDMAGGCDLVDWDGAARSWLLARASAQSRRAPGWLVRAKPRALADRLAPMPTDHPAAQDQIEQQCRLLFDPDVVAGEAAPALIDIAASRARLWWRSASSRGDISVERQADYLGQLKARIAS